MIYKCSKLRTGLDWDGRVFVRTSQEGYERHILQRGHPCCIVPFACILPHCRRAAIRHRALRGAGQPLTRPLTAAERSRISRSGPGAPHHPRRGPAGQRRRRLREARRGGREGGRGVGGRCGTGRGSVGRGVGVARGGGKRRESGVGTKRIFWPSRSANFSTLWAGSPTSPMSAAWREKGAAGAAGAAAGGGGGKWAVAGGAWRSVGRRGGVVWGRKRARRPKEAQRGKKNMPW
jgi:hypothetical protein